MSALDEGMMATLTQEERAAMQATDDAEATLSDDTSGLADEPTKASKDLHTPSKSAAPTTEPNDVEAESSNEVIASDAPDTKNDITSEPLDARTVQTLTSVDVRPQPVPRYEARLPDNFDAQVKALSDKELTTHPFTWQAKTCMRAKMSGDAVQHFVERKYHLNTASPEEGSLVFAIPGWDILEMCKDVGFSRAEMVLIASTSKGLLASSPAYINVLQAYR